MPRRLFYCDHYVIPLPAGHRFPAAKYRLVREMLAKDGFYHFEPAHPADFGIIELVHDPEYVRHFVDGSLPQPEMRRIGFPWSPDLVQRTLASVGGTLGAAQDALATGWGGNLAGGTHHACRNEGSGFCVFNDMAIAINWLRSQGRIRRAAVIDLDVHQGDGTAQIFAQDADVLTVSVHCRNNFPFRKQQSKLDVDLPDNTGDEQYLAALNQVLPRVLAFRPEIILYQSGVDGLASDSLGRLALTHAGLRERDRLVMSSAKTAGIPLAIVLGGGYSLPVELTAEAHANTFRTASHIFA
jgi:acetoin utilization deacetylase AcuC-like enzyme